MGRDPRHVLEDELFELWQRVPLNPADLQEVAPQLVERLSRSNIPAEALAAFQFLLEDVQGDSREAASVAAVFGVGVHAHESIDQRLADAASKYGKESSRTGRRWARRGVEWLAELILRGQQHLDSMTLHVHQQSEEDFTICFFYDSDDAPEPLSYVGVVVNRVPVHPLVWQMNNEVEVRIELEDHPVRFDADNLLQVDVSWVGTGDVDAHIHTQLHAGFGQNTHTTPGHISVTVGKDRDLEQPDTRVIQSS